jgi:phosphoglycolate phosphatase
MNIKLIIFDFDGTLGDTRRNIVTTMQMAIKEMQLPSRTETECASTIGLPLAGCFRTLFPDIQEKLISRCAETYRRIFNENLQKITPEAFPGVVKTLKALKEKGFALTIASSRSRNSLTELTRDMGIADYISYLIGADDVKEAKPRPEPVLKTLTAMHFDASETLVVGDMAVDILMGANAGTKTCGVTWGNGSKEELKEAGANFIIERMEELIEIAEDKSRYEMDCFVR